MHGTIKQIGVWSSGNGFFFKIREDARSFYSYGQPNFKMGDQVNFEPNESKAKFKASTLVKFLAIHKESDSSDTIGEFMDEDSVRSAPIQKEFRAHEARTDRDATITRLACLKAAATTLQGAPYEQVIILAERFVKWAEGKN